MSQTIEYYDQTAAAYDDLHSGDADPEHTRALELGWPLFDGVRSVLDVGSGTGRSLGWINNLQRNVLLHGIEPSQRMIDIAARKVPQASLQQGNGEHLPYLDNSFDVAIATGIMHHVDSPSRVIDEMFRVARIGVLISDHNNYAFGGSNARRARMLLKLTGLLGIATYVRQGFNKRGYSDSDGWWYPYSLADNYAQIASQSKRVFVVPTNRPSNDDNLIFAQSHFAIVALKN